MKSGVSLQQMLTEVKRQSESKEDYLIAPQSPADGILR